MTGQDPIGVELFAQDSQLNCEPLRLEIFMFTPNVNFEEPLQCVALRFMPNIINYFLSNVKNSNYQSHLIAT